MRLDQDGVRDVRTTRPSSVARAPEEPIAARFVHPPPLPPSLPPAERSASPSVASPTCTVSADTRFQPPRFDQSLRVDDAE